MNPKGTAEGMDSDGPPNPTCPTCGKSKEGEGNNDVNWGRHINACSKYIYFKCGIDNDFF